MAKLLAEAIGTFWLVLGECFPAKDVIGCIIAQVVGGIASVCVLYLVASGFASCGYGPHSPGGYTISGSLLIEVVLTAAFLFVIHGANDKRSSAIIAPITIGLCLTLIHLIGIPVTNTSVNPARSTATAVF